MGRRAASDKEKITSIVKDFPEEFICTPNFTRTKSSRFLPKCSYISGIKYTLEETSYPSNAISIYRNGASFTKCCRSKVEKIASEEETRVKRLLKDKLVFLVVDEAEVNGQKYLNILGGNIDTPTEIVALVNSPLAGAAPNASTVFAHVINQ